MTTFSEVYGKFKDDIAMTAMSQRVPGLDYDDIVSEMTTCLWKAWQSYEPCTTSLGSYWWSLWLNRRTDITREANAHKRPRTVSLPPEWLPDRPFFGRMAPMPPRGCTTQERAVWDLLAAGEPVKDVIQKTGLTRRRYYDLITRWRTEDVRLSLMD